MLRIAAALFTVLAASVVYLHAAQPGGLCAVIDHPQLCRQADAPYGMDLLGAANVD